MQQSQDWLEWIFLLKMERLRGAGLVMGLAYLGFLLALGFSSGAVASSCQQHADCRPEEYCETHYSGTCRCRGGHVRSPDGGCVAGRREGETCEYDIQCQLLDLSLVCFEGRCNCPKGLKRPDGVCISVVQVSHSPAPQPPPPAAHHEDKTSDDEVEPQTTSKPYAVAGGSGGYAGPIAICALIVVSFSILIITTAYNFRARNRRLDEVRSILSSRSTSSIAARDGRRASVGSLRDAPPSYHTLQPPSYEQATLDVGSLSSSPTQRRPQTIRRPSYTASMETSAITIPEMDPASRVSYNAVAGTSASASAPPGSSFAEFSCLPFIDDEGSPKRY